MPSVQEIRAHAVRDLATGEERLEELRAAVASEEAHLAELNLFLTMLGVFESARDEESGAAPEPRYPGPAEAAPQSDELEHRASQELSTVERLSRALTPGAQAS